MTVRATLLGRPWIEVAGQRWEPAHDQRSALLYYLASAAGWVARDDLLALFWADRPEAKARAALRQLLMRTARAPFAVALEVERTRVRWDALSDAATLADGSGDLDTWPGRFLDGFRLADAPELEDWLNLERDAWDARWRSWALAHASDALEANVPTRAIDVLDARLLHDPLDEATFRAWCTAAHRLGRRAHVAQRYHAFARSMRSEVGFEPDDATRAAALGDGAAGTQNTVCGEPTTNTTMGQQHDAVHRVLRTNDVLGRTDELDAISSTLRTPGAAFAIVGPGGMGKTTLAAWAAEHLGAGRSGGSTVVSLAGARDLEGVGQALRVALDVAPVPGRRPFDLALERLCERDAVVVLDEVDTLDDARAVLAALRAGAPRIGWVLTSRRFLDADDLTTLELQGLACPVNHASVTTAPAAILVVRLARRLGARVDPDRDANAIIEICRVCGGLPLALELAAGWARVLPLARIAEELCSSIDLLRADGARADGRHGSVRAVLNASWQALSLPARRTLVQLSVFRDGFDDAAAREVAGVGVPQLLALRNASFLGLDPDGRYRQHPLLAAFVAERAMLEPALCAAAAARHARCYLARLERWERDGHGPATGAAIAALQRDHANVEAAWTHALTHGAWDALKAGGPTLGLSYVLAGRPQRWNELHREALAVVPRESAAWAMLEVFDSAIASFEGRTEEAYVRRADALAVLRRRGTERDLAWGLFRLGMAAEALDRVDEANTCLEEAETLYRRIGEPHYLSLVLTHLHDLSRSRREADARFAVADAHDRTTGNRAMRAQLLAQHATASTYLAGRFDHALALVDEAVRLEREAAWSPMHVAMWLRASAWLRIDVGDAGGALAHAREALRLWQPFEAQFPGGAHAAHAAIAWGAWLLRDDDTLAAHLSETAPAASTLEGLLLRTEAALVRGDLPNASACAAAALARTAGVPTRWQQRQRRAAALIAAGRCHAVNRQPDLAAAHLAEALRLARVDPLVPSTLAACAATLPLLGHGADAVAAALRRHHALPYLSRLTLPSDAGTAASARRSVAAKGAADHVAIADTVEHALATRRPIRSSSNRSR